MLLVSVKSLLHKILIHRCGFVTYNASWLARDVKPLKYELVYEFVKKKQFHYLPRWVGQKALIWFNNDTRPAIRAAMPGQRCAIIGLKSNEFRELGNPGSLDSARAFVRPRSALSAPTKRPSSPTYRFRHSNLTRIPAANVLSRPDKDRILRRDKEPPPSVSSRFPDVPVTSRLKNVSCSECKSPSRFQRELDSRLRQTSLMSRPFGRGIRSSSIFGGLYELTRSSGSPLGGLEVRRSTLLKARGDTRSDDSLTAHLAHFQRCLDKLTPEFSFHEAKCAWL